MQRGDDLRAFADRRSNAFDRFCADVADGENATLACLQNVAVMAGILPGQYKAFGVKSDARVGEPVGVWLGADEQEQMTHRPTHFLSGRGKPPAHGAQRAVAAFQRAYLRAGNQPDVGESRDAVDQVS